MQVQCPSCGKVLAAPDERAGQVVACPACGGQMQLPPVREAAAAGPAPGGTAPAGAETKACPYCGETVLKVAKKCKHCGSFLLGGGATLGRTAGKFSLRERMRRKGSGDGKTALIFGILSFVLCTPIFGPLAIIYGNGARKYEAERTVATIGMVLGIISTSILALAVIALAMGALFGGAGP